MATHSSVLAWRIPGLEEPGGLLFMGSHRVGHDWSDLEAAAAASLVHPEALTIGGPCNNNKNFLFLCFTIWIEKQSGKILSFSSLSVSFLFLLANIQNFSGKKKLEYLSLPCHALQSTSNNSKPTLDSPTYFSLFVTVASWILGTNSYGSQGRQIYTPNSKWSESEVAQLCLTLCNPMDCSLPGSSVHGIFQAIVLEWIVISFSNTKLKNNSKSQLELEGKKGCGGRE